MHVGYLSAGANRHTAVADWGSDHGIVAFGADCNVALWRPDVSTISFFLFFFYPPRPDLLYLAPLSAVSSPLSPHPPSMRFSYGLGNNNGPLNLQLTHTSPKLGRGAIFFMG